MYGDQIYDVLGDSEINRSLQELLLEAIRYGKDPAVLAKVDEVIDAEIGNRLKTVLDERALGIERARRIEHQRDPPPHGRGARHASCSPVSSKRSSPRRSTTSAAASPHARPGRFEITRVPAIVRSRDREVAAGGPLHGGV